MNRGPPTPQVPLFPPSTLIKVKFFICCEILMKFKTQHFHMLTNNKYNRNLWLGTPYQGLQKPGFFFIKTKNHFFFSEKQINHWFFWFNWFF